jgi:hypothetical protein
VAASEENVHTEGATMRSHDHDHLDGESLRPKGARLDERPDGQLFEAAAAGRSDVVGREGMLRLQRTVGNSGVRALAEESPVLDVVSSGGGRPLDEPVRTDMESRLGADFGDVRVHTDDHAHTSAQSVNAHAYTVGSNVVFQRDRYDPGSTEGRTMLAHELTHVIQQRNGPVDGAPADGGVRVSDPSDRFEREAAANAERAMSAPAAPVTAGTSAVGVQRQEAPPEEVPEEEPAAQGSFVQRQEEEVPEETPA